MGFRASTAVGAQNNLEPQWQGDTTKLTLLPGTRVVPAMLLYTDETKKVVSADGAAGALRLRPLRYQRDDDAGEHDDGSGLLAIKRLPRAQGDARQEGARPRAVP